MINSKNVFGKTLQPCGIDPVTGYFRDGYCSTDISDTGMHTVCAIVTEDFLKFSKEMGNDLSTPNPLYNFAGLKEGDRWCLCMLRWLEAFDRGCAPKIDLYATNISVLEYIPLSTLKKYQI